ncbi:MAG: hypothetical protein LM580_12300 [Thermofilum sp.]|nr:hypothetical protein [Thermofilum sp.]
MRVAYVGRHRLLPLQQRALEELGMSIVRTIENLPTEPAALSALLNELQAAGIEAIVTIALPPHLLAQLSNRFPLYVFEMRSTTFQTQEEAERWVAEKPEARTYIPGRPGEPVRGLEFAAINRVRVVVESARVWPQSAGQ